VKVVRRPIGAGTTTGPDAARASNQVTDRRREDPATDIMFTPSGCRF
jgi:hypothetical protein